MGEAGAGSSLIAFCLCSACRWLLSSTPRVLPSASLSCPLQLAVLEVSALKRPPSERDTNSRSWCAPFGGQSFKSAQVLPHLPSFSNCSFFFFKRFYLFIHERHRERGRDIGRGRSRLPARTLMGTRSRDPRIMT